MHVAADLENDNHFAVGAALIDTNKNQIELVSIISHQVYRLLVDENARPDDYRKIGVLAGSPEESLTRNMNVDQKSIVALNFDDPVTAYQNLFERVQSGQFKAAFANRHSIAVWHTAQWSPISLFAKLIKGES